MRVASFLVWLATLLFAPTIAGATSTVALKSAVFVERATTTPDGKAKIELRAASTVSPGDKLVFILTYRNESSRPVPDVIITNPVPAPVAFDGTAATADVSVDGGRTWGPLRSLIVKDDSGAARSAMPFDVTHIRWAITKPLPPGATGRLSFKGTVR